MTNSNFSRITQHMPRIHNKENWNNRGKVTITPSQWWRRFFIINFIFPYRVGDRVRLNIHCEKENPNPTVLNSHQLFELFGNDRKNIRFISEINGTDYPLIGNIIDFEGDVEYSIGLNLMYGNPDVIFTTKVESWDTVISKWFWMILAAIMGGAFALIASVVTGFLEVTKKWHIWIP
jgi:hypothetical protein